MELIVAVDCAGGIGKDNALLYHFPEDMKRFRELTMGKTLLMGRKTFLSLPGKHVLPGRKNCVLTGYALEMCSEYPAESADGPFFYASPEDFLAENAENAVIVIGGASVYAQMLAQCDTAYVTEIHAKRPADCHFRLDPTEWHCAERISMQGSAHIAFDFCIYRRK